MLFPTSRILRYGTPVAVLLLTYWWGRRHGTRRAQMLLPGPADYDPPDADELGQIEEDEADLGAAPTGVGAIDYTLDMPGIARASGAQVLAAGARKWISDYRDAKPSRFFEAPAYNVQAYLHAAFWTAVAARLIRSSALAARAAALQAKGSALFGVPGSSYMRGSVKSILQAAGSEIQRSAGSKYAAEIKPVLAALQTTASQADSAQQVRKDRAWITEGAKHAYTDVRQVGGNALDIAAAPTMGLLTVIRAGLGLPRPGTDRDPYPWWQRWGSRAGFGLAALIAFRVYTAGWRGLLPSSLPPRVQALGQPFFRQAASSPTPRRLTAVSPTSPTRKTAPPSEAPSS